MELLIILLLILLNGLFSMSETAVISARKIRLQQLAEKGDQRAASALALAQEPNRFLSTVQVGITLIGVLTGAFGGATIAAEIAVFIRQTPLARYADALAFGLVVVVTTYLSLIIGELVPKRLALQRPERIAAAIARPMNLLSKLTSPLITFLSGSTDAVLFLLGVRASDEPPVTQEEIKTMMQQGTDAGVFEEVEQDMVSGVFRLGNRRAGSLMTPRTEVYWLNIRDSEAENRTKIKESAYSRLPVCDGDVDHVIGLLESKKLLAQMVVGEPFSIEAGMIEAQFVPGSMSASKVIDLFRESAKHIAIVIGEYGGMEGLITMQDLLGEIVGTAEDTTPQATRRDDGSWLVDGLMAVDNFKSQFSIDALPGEHERFSTLGGFVMAQLGNIPAAGEHFEWTKLRIEVMDMDGNRVDKLLVTVMETPAEAAPEMPTDADEVSAAEPAKEEPEA